VIEAKPKRGRGRDIKGGKIWVDKATFRILKVEVETAFLAGYEQDLEECPRYNLTPHIAAAHFYGVDEERHPVSEPLGNPRGIYGLGQAPKRYQGKD